MSKTIVKKSSEIEEFSESKLKKSIINAFKAVSMGYSKKLIDNIISQLVIEDKTSSNDIRNQLEVILMNSGYYNVAKAFIAYEQKKLLHDRDVNDRIDFIKKYCESINSASGSQFDANANVDNKNIATLIGEIPKGMFIKINRKLLYNKIKKLYGKKTADKYIKLLKEHHLYKNDETSINSYTYAGSNIIYVFSYENNDYFDVSIKIFYENLGIDEVCVDKENEVYQKIPTKLYVKDRNGKVKVTVLTKKKCHRAMYKITFVDDSIKPLIITDNHPLIIDEDKNNTITADKITNKQSQFIINQRKWVEIKSCEKVEDFNDEFIYDITTESETLIVNNIWCHNCASITMYPWLLSGTKDIGGNSTNPTNLKAFCGGLVNMVFMVSSMLSGACLYKNQEIGIIDILGQCKKYKISEFVNALLNENSLNKNFHNYQGNWTYQDLIGVNVRINDGKSNTKITKVYKRTYNDLIYTIRTNTGKQLSCTKDHRIKTVIDERVIDIPAEKLKINDLVYISNGNNKQEIDYITSINTFMNDDEYVYEIETESHYYEAGGIIQHNCSTPEFLMYMTHFLEQEYGEDFYKDPEKIVDLSKKQRTIDKVITDCFEQVVYSLNQPTGARNFQCVKETTELWTPEGFKKLSELKEGDLCYVWKDGHYDIEPIKKLNVYDYDGELIQFTGRNYQQTVTPNHRVLYKLNKKYCIKEAKELLNHSKLSLPIAANYNCNKDYDISDDLLKLVTYSLTDGNINKIEGKQDRLQFYVSPNRKAYHDLINIFNKLNYEYSDIEQHVNLFGKVNKLSLKTEQSKILLKYINHTKKDIPEFFRKLSSRQANIVIDCWVNSDGHCSHGFVKYLQCDNMEVARKLQEIVLISGQGSEIEYINKSSLTKCGETVKTLYVKIFKRTCKNSNKQEYVKYKGKVWCPTTDAGVVVFREENNVPYISGNSVFWNIAYYDHYYFNSLFENFVFPGGSKPKWESVSWLQKRFMKWFNQERKKTVLTFPVETMAMLYEVDNKGKVHFKDQEYEDFTAEMYSEGHSFFTYLSNRADSLSSCCFSGDQKVIIKDNSVKTISFKEAYNIWNDNCKIFHNNEWKDGKVIRLPKRKMFKIVTESNKEIIVSDNHINPTQRGDISTDKLTINDELFISTGDITIPTFDPIKSIEQIEYNDDYIYCFEMKDQNDPYFTLANGIITHNCRLRNELTDNTFSYTLGAGGVSSGSKSVLTININRVVQWASKNNIDYKEYLTEVVDLCHKVQTAYNDNLKDLQNAGMLPLYDAGYIAINRQYLTIGVNGIVEAAEFLGLDITDNPKYAEFVESVLSVVENLNKQYRTKELMFNCEMIPAENVGVKHAKWDKEDGYFVPRDCYNSYFYRVEDKTLTIIDKIKLHGKKYIQHLTGGSALHLNLEEHLSKEQYKKVLEIAAKEGCNYLTFNVPNTLCNDCGNIDKRYLKECPKCHSKNVDYLTRIIGYLKRISNFSEGRQIEAKKRNYHNANKEKTEISSTK